ncbi:hypothetical protein ABAC402_04455 [Asticcacaulis sp. AC402]|nr:hypothetical protein ABAC402_04455 [Asticcacaulis sp. AC402]
MVLAIAADDTAFSVKLLEAVRALFANEHAVKAW